MNTIKQFGLPLVLILFSSTVLLDCNYLFADPARPKEGSIEFGAAENPAKDAADKLGSFKTVFADVAEKVVPTVVSVIPTRVDTVVFYDNPFYHFFDAPFPHNDPFEFFFGIPRRRDTPHAKPKVRKEERRRQGLGSGVIVSAEGYILTNYHVVSGADEIEVKLYDGRVFEAEIVGSDSLSDVAVIKISDEVDDVPVAYLGDSDKLRPGDWVIAIGNPFSLTSSVTTGIVSAKGRAVMGGMKYQNFIQTDAAINPGNSGGALVNIDGELVGINTMIYTKHGGYMGISFAVPINMARDIMEDLIYRGRVVRGWMGVTIQDVDAAVREATGLGRRKGVLIGDVYAGDPADKAGIKAGDIILSIDGRDVATANELRNVVATLEPGRNVTVVVFRNGKRKELSMKVARRDERRIAKLTKADEDETPKESRESLYERLGIRVANLTAGLLEKYDLDGNARGVVVQKVNPKLRDVRDNIQTGDIIRRLKTSRGDFVEVRDVDDLEKAAARVEDGDAVMLQIQRDGRTFFAAFTIRG